MVQGSKGPSRTHSPAIVDDEARKKRLKKPYGGLHPEEVAEYIPTPRVGISKLNNKDRYGTLTDKSRYEEYAWAFLRRNRYYQRFVDGKASAATLGEWAYGGCPDRDPSYGLVRIKHYSEPFATGGPPEWLGIHDFEPIHQPSGGPLKSSPVRCDYPESQVAMIFDIGPLLDKGTTAIEPQLSMTRLYLQHLAKKAGIFSFPRRRAPSKAKLRAQLRVADLLSAPSALTLASDIDGSAGPDNPKQTKRKVDKSQILTSHLKVGDLVSHDMIPAYDLDRKSRKAGKKTGTIDRPTKTKRISDLATNAWNNIYNWGLLELLQFDSWDEMVADKINKKNPPTKDANRQPGDLDNRTIAKTITRRTATTA